MANKIKKEISITATGDSIIAQRQSIHIEKEFLSLIELIRNSDISFTNLETTLHNFEGYPSARVGGPYLCSNPQMIEELKWMGFNLFSCANNHATDYSEGGLIATMKNLDKARIAYAGIGKNLAEAKSPVFLEIAKGRVALISAASESFGRAGAARNDMQGRPGINPLRFDIYYAVNKETLEKIRKISDELGLLEVYAEQNEFYFLGNRFIENSQVGIHTSPNEADAEENLESIREAKRQADWIVFSLHSHRGKSGRNDQEPAEFMEKFAHKCIDEGVHVFIGHGYHALRGIEIYNERPIFYSLGNFISQSVNIKKQPAEYYEYVGLNPYLGTPKEIVDIRKKIPYRSGRRPNEWSYEKNATWESVVAYMYFQGDKLSELKLYPISLSSDFLSSQRGRPMMADKQHGEKILTKLQELSIPFDTKIEIKEGVGTIKI